MPNVSTIVLTSIALSIFLLVKFLSRRVHRTPEKDKHEYLETIIENITDIITILEVDGKIRYESTSSQRVLGYQPDELIGKSAFDFIHKDDIPQVKDIIKRNILNPNFIDHVEYRFQHKDGTWRLLESWGKNLMFHPQVHGIVVCSRDVTERRKAEEKIALQSAVLEVAANAIIITDFRGNIIWINPSFTNLTGYSSEDVVGKNPRILKSGEQSSDFYKKLWQTISSGHVWTGELINRRKDGTHYFEKMTITPVRQFGKEITHFVAVKEDISENKKLEIQFRQAQKMEVLGRLSGGVAHDFNNLLTIIIGYSDLLLSKIQDARLREEISEVRMAGERATRLTRQLLAFSRRQILQLRALDLNPVVQNTDKMIRRLLGADIELVTVLEPALKRVRVDVGQLEQVILNLAVNARDAMPNGGKIIIETRNVSFEESKNLKDPGIVAGEYVLLSMRDSGTGMSDEVKKHLFEPFYTTKEAGKGTGLGLSTTYGIVKQQKGYIYVDSVLGGGATFRIYLPVTDEKMESSAPAGPQDIPRGAESVLLVEDEGVLRNLSSHILSQYGYLVYNTGTWFMKLPEVLKLLSWPGNSITEMEKLICW